MEAVIPDTVFGAVEEVDYGVRFEDFGEQFDVVSPARFEEQFAGSRTLTKLASNL